MISVLKYATESRKVAISDPTPGSFPTIVLPGSRPHGTPEGNPRVLFIRLSFCPPCITLFDRITSTAIGMLVDQAWGWSLAGIQRICSGAALPKTSTPSSPAVRFPQGIVEMIIVYLIHDGLCACTPTCRCCPLFPHPGHINPKFEWSHKIASSIFHYQKCPDPQRSNQRYFFPGAAQLPYSISVYNIIQFEDLDIHKLDISNFMQCIGHTLVISCRQFDLFP